MGKEGEILCLSCMTSTGPGTAVCAALVPFGQGKSLRHSSHFQLIEEENEAENRKLISSGLLWQETSTRIDPTSPSVSICIGLSSHALIHSFVPSLNHSFAISFHPYIYWHGTVGTVKLNPKYRISGQHSAVLIPLTNILILRRTRKTKS